MDFSLLPLLGENRPDLYAIQWDAVIEASAAIVLLSMVVERSLSPVFESNFYIRKQTQWKSEGRGNFKAPIAMAVSLLVCFATGIDILAVIAQAPAPSYVGTIMSAGVVAGGSKGSIKLFRDILGFKSSAYDTYEKNKKAEDEINQQLHVKNLVNSAN